MIICPICFKECKRLGNHIYAAHGEGQKKLLGNKSKSGQVPWNKEKTFKKSKDKIHPAWNKGQTAETNPVIAKMAAAAKGKPGKSITPSQETKDKISIAMRGNTNGKHRGDRQSFHNGVRMDSSWEVKVAKYFDDNHIKYKYAEKVFPLSENTSYRPDFELDDGTIIEVKGYWRKENRAKFDLWVSLYPSVRYEVWDKTKLKELKLL